METLPLFLKLVGRPCLLVGGGAAAASKAELLLRSGARLTVAADALSPQLAARQADGAFRLRPLAEAETLVAGQALVIVASDDEGLARRVAAAAQAANVPVNVVDSPALSSAIMGAIVDRSPIIVAVSSGGASPLLARDVRQAIERLLPSGLGRLALFAERFRGAVKAAIAPGVARRRFWEKFLAGPVAEAVLAGDEAEAQALMLSLVNRADRGARQGIVHILGAGPGDPDLLTAKALRLLGQADLVLHDRLLEPAILDRARRDAERIPADAAVGDPRVINRLLEGWAREGRRVVRLKAGDGSGGDELVYLQRRGIAAELVPGVSQPADHEAAPLPLPRREIVNG